MNRPLLRHTWRAQRLKLVVVAAALAIWGFLMPVVYAEFGAEFKRLFDSGIIPRQFAEFGGGNVFSLNGSVSLGFIHPIAVALEMVFAVGFSAAAVAGERQRGTLEVLLSRPLSRRSVYATLLAAVAGFVAIAVAAHLVGTLAGAVAFGVAEELSIERLPLLWLNGLLLYAALAAIGLAASVTFDRLTPALGVSLGVVIVSYFLDVLGTLWPDAKGLQPYSLFHYLRPRELLGGTSPAADIAFLALVTAAAVAYALVVFPRRDLAAPS